MGKQNQNAMNTFDAGSPFSAVVRNAVPSICAMLMSLVYNLADTFFISMTHDDLQIAAVSLATPVFMIFMSLGTLFGMGGSSIISRDLGTGNNKHARKASAFCTWACVFAGIIFIALLWIFMNPLTRMIGASNQTFAYTKTYLSIVTGSGIFLMLTNNFANLLRAEGKAAEGMIGTIIGNGLNIVLDPIFISGLHMEITGAAIATVIGNVAGAVYYLMIYLHGKSILSIRLKDADGSKNIAMGVFAIGTPACLTSLLMSVSQIIANSRMSAYGDTMVAAYGVEQKINMIVATIAAGIGIGIMPLLGYCYGAEKKGRFLNCFKVSIGFSLAVCGCLDFLCYAFARPMSSVFLTGEDAISYGAQFVRVIMLTGWLSGMIQVMQNTMEAIGAAEPSLLISVSKQGIIYIPMLFIMQALVGMSGLIWAQPISDIATFAIATMLTVRIARKTGMLVKDASV